MHRHPLTYDIDPIRDWSTRTGKLRKLPFGTSSRLELPESGNPAWADSSRNPEHLVYYGFQQIVNPLGVCMVLGKLGDESRAASPCGTAFRLRR